MKHATVNYFAIPGVKSKTLTVEILPTIEEIAELVSLKTGIPVLSMKGKTRKQEITTARHIAMTLAKKYTHKSLKAVGEFFNRDHTTTIHARNAIANECATDEYFRLFYMTLENKFVNNQFVG